MDHTRLLNAVRSKATLARAFEYAVFDRRRVDNYADLFELEFAQKNKERLLGELAEELAAPARYVQRNAYAYFVPKNDLTFRRMIHLNFKDLVLRYAFALEFSQALSCHFRDACFANRRAKTGPSFLEHFASAGWPNWVRWQDAQIEQGYTCLLRTDIAAFYDSISHDYFVETIADELQVDAQTDLIALFRQVLAVPVLSYADAQRPGPATDVMRQGLPIGNNTEGFFANIYLKAIDEAMSDALPDVQFGRYVDDMRIFGRERAATLNALRVLQQLLLTKGLNLNSSKTRLADDEKKMEALRSKEADIFPYLEEDELEAGTAARANVDRALDDFAKPFEEVARLAETEDAKLFCRYLSQSEAENAWEPAIERTPEHLDQIETVLARFSGCSRHAAWLLVQSAFASPFKVPLQRKAKRKMLDVLSSEAINPYAKCRILHHLVRPKIGHCKQRYCYLYNLTRKELGELRDILADLVGAPAFELGITALYVRKEMGASMQELEDLTARARIPARNAEPFQNALSYAERPDSAGQATTSAQSYASHAGVAEGEDRAGMGDWAQDEAGGYPSSHPGPDVKISFSQAAQKELEGVEVEISDEAMKHFIPEEESDGSAVRGKAANGTVQKEQLNSNPASRRRVGGTASFSSRGKKRKLRKPSS